jgi:tetratricopeptide (TPR) repeat protein
MAHARIGVTYLFWSRHDEATPHLERAFRLAGRLRDQDRLYVAAWYAQAGRDYEAAARTYKELLGRFPEELEACQQLAGLLIGEERFDEARKIIQAALKLNPASPKTYNLLSELELNTFHFDEAVAAAQRLVALAPTEPNALDSLGLSHEARGNFREAENAYRAALRLQPDFEIAVIHLGNALTRQGRYKEAEETYKRYIRVTASPQDQLRGYVSLGLLHRLQGDIVRAREAAQRNPNGEAAILLALDRGDVALAENLLAQREQGSDRGRRISQRFLLYLYGQRALSAGNVEEAFSHFRQALETRTPFWSFNWYEDCLGDAFLKAGQPEAAIQEYQRVLQRYPKLALVWYHLAQAYARKGLPLQERSAMSRVLEIWRDADRDVPEWISASRVVGQTPIAGIARASQSDSTPLR